MQPCRSAVMVLRPPPQTTCEQRKVVVSWKNYSCEQAAGWPEPEGQSPSCWDVTDLHITTVWETVRKCQALFVTQHFHFPHKWPPGKTGARDVSPVWPLPWTLPPINAAQARWGDSTKSWGRSTVSGNLYLGRWHSSVAPMTGRWQMYETRQSSALGPGAATRRCVLFLTHVNPRGRFYLAAWP